MAKYTELDTRMKENYENVSKTQLLRRTPVAIRIDGKAFHTFTRNFQKPFDEILVTTMQDTMKYMCEQVQGCVFGYTQSDEITLILIDYKKRNSEAWFDYKVQKMCSVAASMATMAFNDFFAREVEKEKFDYKTSLVPQSMELMEKTRAYHKILDDAVNKAMFDARCFNIPKEEVTNLIYWRQLDATRNSIQMVGQANFSHKELHGKTCDDIQDMLHEIKGINWNNCPTYLKRGSACIKGVDGWKIDLDMPILKGEDRKYVDDLIFVGE